MRDPQELSPVWLFKCMCMSLRINYFDFSVHPFLKANIVTNVSPNLSLKCFRGESHSPDSTGHLFHLPLPIFNINGTMVYLARWQEQIFETRKDIFRWKKEKTLGCHSLIIFSNNISNNESHILWNNASLDLECIHWSIFIVSCMANL